MRLRERIKRWFGSGWSAHRLVDHERRGHIPPRPLPPRPPPRPPPQQDFDTQGRPLYSPEEIARRTAESVSYYAKEQKQMGRFQVFKDKSGQWRWRLRSRNGRVVAQSEAYSRKSSAVRAVQAIDRALHPGYVVELPE